MKTSKYIVHFIQNDYMGTDNDGKYANAIELATSKEEALKLAGMRAHFKEAFLVNIAHQNDFTKVKSVMVTRYGNHKGIA